MAIWLARRPISLRSTWAMRIPVLNEHEISSPNSNLITHHETKPCLKHSTEVLSPASTYQSVTSQKQSPSHHSFARSLKQHIHDQSRTPRDLSHLSTITANRSRIASQETAQPDEKLIRRDTTDELITLTWPRSHERGKNWNSSRSHCQLLAYCDNLHARLTDARSLNDSVPLMHVCRGRWSE